MEMRTPPHNLDAERSILGGLMVEPEAFDSVFEILHPNDFYKVVHQKIYQVILDLHNRKESVDIITVNNALTQKKELEQIGGPAVLAEIMNQYPTAINIQQYAKIVKEKALLRKLIRINTEILDCAYDQSYENIDAFIDEVEGKVFGISQQRETGTGLVGAAELIKLSIDKLTELSTRKEDIIGIASGFQPLDKMTAGFQAGDLIILAARPSMGKTAFSLNLALNSALRSNKKVAYFSVEMGKEQLMMRMLATEARINMSDLRVGRIKDNDWPRLIEKASKLGDSNIFIDDTSGISPYEIRSKARRLKHQHGLDLIIVDYLQIMKLRTKIESREREVAEISRSLKAVAKELEVPVIALAQLNRGVEGRTGDMRKPVLSDLRESGSIEQDADLIMMLYREEYYDPDNPEIKGQADLLVRKHRNGPVGEVKLRWEAKYGQFTDWHEATPTQPMAPPPTPIHSGGKPKNFAPTS
ncbi:MAG: replicative DNA helicase [Bdellovibrionales bacterium]|nr:replicative DNA helicase [Bdellovibrionales bacterium]